MRAYSSDLRERIIEAVHERKGTILQVAILFSVSVSWVYRLLQRQRKTGSIDPLPRGGRKLKLSTEDQERLAKLVAEDSDATLEELRERLEVNVCLSTIHRTLATMHISLKKKTTRAAEQDRDDVKKERQEFLEEIQNIPPERLKFLDEAGCNTKMTTPYGRGPVGERVVESVPHGHYQTTTVIGCVGLDHMHGSLIISGPADGAVFLQYVQEILVPTLQPGDVVLMDNVSLHKVAGVEEAINAAGARLRYLPRYSPDLNPIEKVWSKIKAFVKKAAARTQEALWPAICDAFSTITKEDCEGYFGHCGYVST